MAVELWLVAVLATVSFAAGFIDSIAGGGGLLLLPALLLTGLPPRRSPSCWSRCSSNTAFGMPEGR